MQEIFDAVSNHYNIDQKALETEKEKMLERYMEAE